MGNTFSGKKETSTQSSTTSSNSKPSSTFSELFGAQKLAPKAPVTTEDSPECPICFLNYEALNEMICCRGGICSNCYLEIKGNNAKNQTCPFCTTLSFSVTYKGVLLSAPSSPTAATLDNSGNEQASSLSSSPSSGTKPRSGSMGSPPVVASIKDRQELEKAMRSQRMHEERAFSSTNTQRGRVIRQQSAPMSTGSRVSSSREADDNETDADRNHTTLSAVRSSRVRQFQHASSSQNRNHQEMNPNDMTRAGFNPRMWPSNPTRSPQQNRSIASSAAFNNRSRGLNRDVEMEEEEETPPFSPSRRASGGRMSRQAGRRSKGLSSDEEFALLQSYLHGTETSTPGFDPFSSLFGSEARGAEDIEEMMLMEAIKLSLEESMKSSASESSSTEGKPKKVDETETAAPLAPPVIPPASIDDSSGDDAREVNRVFGLATAALSVAEEDSDVAPRAGSNIARTSDVIYGLPVTENREVREVNGSRAVVFDEDEEALALALSMSLAESSSSTCSTSEINVGAESSISGNVASLSEQEVSNLGTEEVLELIRVALATPAPGSALSQLESMEPQPSIRELETNLQDIHIELDAVAVPVEESVNSGQNTVQSVDETETGITELLLQASM